MKRFTAWQVRSLVTTTVSLAGLYFITYFFVWAIVTPVQADLLPEITRFASLLFLPHGIRVFATSLLGGKAVPGLILGELAGNYLLWGLHDPLLLLLGSVVSGGVTWVVFEGLLGLRINAYYLRIAEQPPPLHTLMLAGILASAANAFLSTALSEPEMSAGHVTSVLAAYMTGDITGLLAVMVMARHLLPLLGLTRE